MPRFLNWSLSLTFPTKTLYGLSSAPHVPHSVLLIQDCFCMYWNEYLRPNCVLLCCQLYYSVHSLNRCKNLNMCWCVEKVEMETYISVLIWQTCWIHRHFSASLSKPAENRNSLAIAICIMQLHCSHDSWATDYANRGVSWFLQVLHTNVGLGT